MTRPLKVGIFVFVGLALTMLGVFMIGEEREFWDAKVTFNAAFNDVAGLKPGAPVRLGGFDIGSVSQVGHSSQGSDTRIHVKFSIIKKEAVRVRVGTKASIVNKGLLGDKMVELTVPDPAAPELADNGDLVSDEPLDLTKYLEKFDAIADAAQKTLENIQAATKPFADPKFAEEVQGSLTSINLILGGVARNDSAAHRFLMDPSEGEKMDRLLADLDATTQRASAVMGDMSDVTRHVKEGPGLAHAIVYDGEMSKSAAGTLQEVHKDLEAIRQGNGFAHELIFGDESGQHVMKNIDAMSDDLRAIVANLRQGRGTLGALLVDPSVYEDVKSAVGNVERNQVLRALVRYSIKADEQRPQPRVTTPPEK